jgi:tetratricopeptide (TPR) repeat protein
MRYKNSNKSLQEIGTELKVAAVLEGSVRRQGDKLRIVAQLIDAKTDNHIWAETYDREMKDVFAIQSDVAQKIASALQAKLMPEEKKQIEQIPTQDLVAYDYYLKGRQYFLRYQTQYNENAIQFFQKAIDADPNFTLAYVGLCDSLAMQKPYGVPGASFDAAMDACKKALSIDPNLATTYSTLYKVYTFYGFIEKGEEAIQKAYELDPNNAIVVGRLGSEYLEKGKLVEAFRLTKRFLELEPTNAFGYFTMGIIYYDLADFRQAELSLKKSIELQPDLDFPYIALVRLYISQGRFKQALETARGLNSTEPKLMFDLMGLTEGMSGNYQKTVEYFPKGTRRFLEGRFAHALLKTGRTKEAQKVLEETKQKILELLKERQRDQNLEYFATVIFATQGSKDEALKYLQNACDDGYWYYHFLERDPIFEGMRKDPQFQQIIENMKSRVAEARHELGM